METTELSCRGVAVVFPSLNLFLCPFMTEWLLTSASAFSDTCYHGISRYCFYHQKSVEEH